MNNQWGTYKQNIQQNIDKKEDQLLGRVIEQNRGHFRIACGERILQGELQGKLRKNQKEGLPVIGDWVRFEEHPGLALITEGLPRTSVLSRKVAGNVTREQALAANIDKVAIVLALDGGRNYSVRTLERYLTMAWNSGAQPLILLNKTDLAETPEDFLREAEFHAPGVPVFLTSAEDHRGVEELRAQILPGETLVLVGPSGVGKSALTNALTSGAPQKTGANREGDKRGRHTTTSARMVLLDGGGLLIDSPGLREIQLWGDEEGLDAVFQEILEYSRDCRFRDCSHQGEPGCAVQQALQQGVLSPERFQSYLELQKELHYLELRKEEKIKVQKEKGKNLSKYVKHMKSGKTVY